MTGIRSYLVFRHTDGTFYYLTDEQDGLVSARTLVGDRKIVRHKEVWEREFQRSGGHIYRETQH